MTRAFAKLGFASPEIVKREGYVFAAYPKFQSRSPDLKHWSGDEFGFICGTCISKRGVGIEAAARFPELFDSTDAKVMGHFAAVFGNPRQLRIKLDSFGGYHVFYDPAARIVSSSFYALAATRRPLTLSPQNVYEYVFNGVVSGDETLFDEIKLAGINSTIVLTGGELQIIEPKLQSPNSFVSDPRDLSLRRTISLLDRYFGALAGTFEDRINCALSGGYDSRLMLACLRRHGIKPRLFVYGNSSEPDVRFASQLAHGERLELQIIDKSARPRIPAEEFAAIARENFFAADGYGYAGIFHNGRETEESARRVEGGFVACNGGGGEIFRNFFYLPDRVYTMRELLWSFYSRFEPAACARVFDAESYYRGLERKIAKLIGHGVQKLLRPQIEWLYHNFRCRAWDGKVDSVASRYGFTGMPFLERPISEHASRVPVYWKNHGAYEAELIHRIDHSLARYLSIYGHSFSSSPPLLRRALDCATYLRPPWVRRYTYRIKHRLVPEVPIDYLAKPYQKAVLPDGVVALRKLFKVEKIHDPAQFARVLSLEYALRQFDDVKFGECGRIR